MIEYPSHWKNLRISTIRNEYLNTKIQVAFQEHSCVQDIPCMINGYQKHSNVHVSFVPKLGQIIMFIIITKYEIWSLASNEFCASMTYSPEN